MDDMCKNCGHPMEAHALGSDTAGANVGDDGYDEGSAAREACHADGCDCTGFEGGGELTSDTAYDASSGEIPEAASPAEAPAENSPATAPSEGSATVEAPTATGGASG